MDLMSNETIALRLKWADALESGRYGQTRFKLRERTNTITDKVPTYRYCPLGVAMEELGDHTWDNSGRNHILSVVACKLLGIWDSDLKYDDIVELNDQGKLSFTEIAAEIRKHTPEPTKETKACNCPSALSSMGWSQQHQATCKWFKEDIE